MSPLFSSFFSYFFPLFSSHHMSQSHKEQQSMATFFSILFFITVH